MDVAFLGVDAHTEEVDLLSPSPKGRRVILVLDLVECLPGRTYFEFGDVETVAGLEHRVDPASMSLNLTSRVHTHQLMLITGLS